ncbi:MAG: Ku protein [Rhodospirillales bacterium]|jgi:DNA end-binding protein Ku|nr:Ku protein [Rhodospirillales bacterium]
MPLRASWKGHLRLSLVSCPVRLYNASSAGKRVSFNLLHQETNNRVRMVPHDPERGAVDRSELVRGYEYERDRYVVVSDEDLAKVKLESSEIIDIESFVDVDEADPIYFESPYYLAPDGAVAEETFRVIREAMRRKNKIALSRIVLSSREHLIAMSVRNKGIMVTTLRTADEVRADEPYFADIRDEAPEPELVELAEQLIEKKSAPFDPASFHDRYQDALLELVKAKIKGEEPVIAKAPERGKVINLMDALKRSVGDAEERKPPATSRPATARPAAGARSGASAGSRSTTRRKKAAGDQ